MSPTGKPSRAVEWLKPAYWILVNWKPNKAWFYLINSASGVTYWRDYDHQE